jgi:hypothetical protein
VPLFPPGIPVSVVVDGRSLAAYPGAYLASGRVYASVDPLITGIADRIYYEGRGLVIERGNRRVVVALIGPAPAAFGSLYVMAAPLLRALGASVRFDARSDVLTVRSGRNGELASPTPFGTTLPAATPGTVFTPEPAVTPRPVWTGSPLPRRTPLPFFTPPAEAEPPSL